MHGMGVYVIITNPVLPYEKVAELCVLHKVKMLQLREKKLSDKEVLAIAKKLRSITKNSETQLVINDRPDIAMLCGADYVHLGQDDLPIEEVRKLYPQLKVGLSTHSLLQVREALSKNPDYIAFGPIYSTNAKEKPDPPVGVTNLHKVVQLSPVEVVAIGGIFPENIDHVLKTGVKSIACIRYLMSTDQFEQRLIHLQQIINSK